MGMGSLVKYVLAAALLFAAYILAKDGASRAGLSL